MSETTKTEIKINFDELRIAALNADGILFQQRVKSTLEQSGLAFHAAEFGVNTSRSDKDHYFRESQLDLWFRFFHDGCVFEILIECKKADPALKEWVFFKTDDFRSVHYCEFVARAENSKWQKARINIVYDSFRAFAGRELKGEWTSKKGLTNSQKTEKAFWKTSSDRIDKACDQVAIATRGISFSLRDNRDIFSTSGGQPHFVIPVVITNASLFSCDLKEAFHNSTSDEVSVDQVDFKKIRSLVIQYALSSHLQPVLQSTQEEMSKTYVSGTGYQDILICNLPEAGKEIIRLCKAAAEQIAKK